MARIPVYQQGVSARQGLGPGPTGARPIAAPEVGLGDLAGAIGQVAGVYLDAKQKKDREDAAAWSAEQLGNARLHWTQQQIEREQNAPAGAKDYTGTLTKDFDGYADNLLLSAPNDEARNYLRERLTAMKTDIVGRGMQFEAASRLNDRVEKIGKGIDQSRIAVDLDPGQYQQAIAENLATLDQLDIPEQSKVKLRDKAIQDISFAAVSSRLRSSPGQVLQQLGRQDSGGASDVAMLSADNRIRLRNAAEAEIKRREAEAKQAAAISRAELGFRVQDATAAYMQGLQFDNPPTAAELKAAYGAERGQRAFEALSGAQQYGIGVQEYATLPVSERKAFLEKHAPAINGVASEGFAEQSQIFGRMLKDAQNINRQLVEDGAGYAIKYAPEVNAAWQGVMSAADPDSAPAAYQAYAEAVKGEQARLGAPQISVIPASYAAQMAATFKDPANAGPKQIQLIEEMKRNWGQHFPDVFKQVAGDLPDSVKIIGSGTDRDTATLLSSIAPVKTKELKAPLLSADVNAMDQDLKSALEPFGRTFASQSGGAATYGSIYNEAYRGALAQMAQGKSPGDAAKDMARRLSANYQVDGSLRVPKEYDIDSVQEGIHAVVSGIKADDLMLSDIPGVGVEFKDQRAQAILKNATAVANKDETGIYLLHNGGAILGKDGRPLEYTFDQLIGAGATKQKQADSPRANLIKQGFR